MNRNVSWAISLLLVVSGCAPKVLTDVQKDGFRGRVKSVETHIAKITNNPHALAEGQRTLLTITTYDDNGLKLQAGVYWVDKTPIGDVFDVVDAQGRRINVMSYYANASLDAKLLTVYDATGKETEELAFGADGGICSRTVYAYPDGGAPQETIHGSCEAHSVMWATTATERGAPKERVLGDAVDGVVLLRAVYQYDKKGKAAAVASYGGNDELLGTWTFAYDGRGNRTEATLTMGDGLVLGKWRYGYEVDRKKNWLKRTTERAIQNDGKEAIQPTERIYREITYWSKKR